MTRKVWVLLTKEHKFIDVFKYKNEGHALEFEGDYIIKGKLIYKKGEYKNVKIIK